MRYEIRWINKNNNYYEVVFSSSSFDLITEQLNRCKNAVTCSTCYILRVYDNLKKDYLILWD